ncbi:hypothetical protein [Saccharothrix deserti]|uniref:hypothetical protein n=1 Tax=Saccharothrix deserti TaxID=2593674 RepID=UPI00131B2CD3|nr:hypothetical protein [Saccharothrix deserti]
MAALLAVMGMSAAPANAQPSPFSDLIAVQEATARFHSVHEAVAAGYLPTNECVPGMGYHWVNPALFEPPGESRLDLRKPEVLLYERTARGGLRLTGVEYLWSDADQDLRTDNDRPSLFGVPFVGPMEGHGPGMPKHYELHAWVWKYNANGLFAQENPKVTC